MSSESVDTNPDAVKVLSDDEVAEIEARNRLDHCRVVVSSAIPGCICYRPKGHSGSHSQPVHPDDSFWTHPDIPALCATVRALRQQNRELKAIVDIGTSDDPGTALAKIHKIQNDATTALREQLARVTQCDKCDLYEDHYEPQH